jgi:DNA polymerase I
MVVDGDSLGHRAYHAMPPVEGAGGKPVGLLLGFANMLLVHVATRRPRAVLVCLDSRRRSYRHELLPQYQGKRDPFPEDLTSQLDLLPELAEAFGFASAKIEPWEADDLLASAVAAEEARGGTNLVLTSDRDSFQLVSDRTTVLVPVRGGGEPEEVGPAQVVERYGVEPEQVVDLIALRGDPSDNIPGAKGIGQKTAAELLRQYGDLEGVIDHARELSPARRQAIAGAADDIHRFRDVARMRADVPLPPVPDAQLDAERAARWCAEQGMLALSDRIRET